MMMTEKEGIDSNLVSDVCWFNSYSVWHLTLLLLFVPCIPHSHLLLLLLLTLHYHAQFPPHCWLWLVDCSVRLLPFPLHLLWLVGFHICFSYVVPRCYHLFPVDSRSHDLTFVYLLIPGLFTFCYVTVPHGYTRGYVDVHLHGCYLYVGLTWLQLDATLTLFVPVVPRIPVYYIYHTVPSTVPRCRLDGCARLRYTHTRSYVLWPCCPFLTQWPLAHCPQVEESGRQQRRGRQRK